MSGPFYLLARKKGSDEHFRFVSYQRTKGNTGPLDIGLTMHNPSDYGMSQEILPEATQHLGRRGYEFFVGRHLSGSQDGIDLDQIVLVEDTLPALLEAIDKKESQRTTRKGI